MQRLGLVGKLKPECVDRYTELHAAVWPTVLERIKDCHLQNYSIYYRRLPDGGHYLFSYLEYVGDDFDADMQRMAADPETQRWWAECKPCFEELDGLAAGEVWLPLEQVFFTD